MADQTRRRNRHTDPKPMQRGPEPTADSSKSSTDQLRRLTEPPTPLQAAGCTEAVRRFPVEDMNPAAQWHHDPAPVDPDFGVELADDALFAVLVASVVRDRYTGWPQDFNSNQQVRFTRPAHGRPVVVIHRGIPWIPVYGRYYVLCGEGSDNVGGVSEVPYLINRKDPPYNDPAYRDQSLWLGMIMPSPAIIAQAAVYTFEDFHPRLQRKMVFPRHEGTDQFYSVEDHGLVPFSALGTWSTGGGFARGVAVERQVAVDEPSAQWTTDNWLTMPVQSRRAIDATHQHYAGPALTPMAAYDPNEGRVTPQDEPPKPTDTNPVTMNFTPGNPFLTAPSDNRFFAFIARVSAAAPSAYERMMRTVRSAKIEWTTRYGPLPRAENVLDLQFIAHSNRGPRSSSHLTSFFQTFFAMSDETNGPRVIIIIGWDGLTTNVETLFALFERHLERTAFFIRLLMDEDSHFVEIDMREVFKLLAGQSVLAPKISSLEYKVRFEVAASVKEGMSDLSIQRAQAVRTRNIPTTSMAPGRSINQLIDPFLMSTGTTPSTLQRHQQPTTPGQQLSSHASLWATAQTYQSQPTLTPLMEALDRQLSVGDLPMIPQPSTVDDHQTLPPCPNPDAPHPRGPPSKEARMNLTVPDTDDSISDDAF